MEVTCRFCKKKIDKDNSYSNGKGMYYCNKEHCDLQKNKIKYKSPRSNKNGEENTRRKLTDYILSLYDEQHISKYDINWSMICARLKNIMDENPNMTYSGIQYCLWYCKEIKGIDLFSDKSNTVLWCVPFEYENAKRYWQEEYELEQVMTEYVYEPNVEVIKINKNKSKFKPINIDNI